MTTFTIASLEYLLYESMQGFSHSMIGMSSKENTQLVGKLRKHEVPRYSQIGNAIPPLFGEQAALTLNDILNG